MTNHESMPTNIWLIYNRHNKNTISSRNQSTLNLVSFLLTLTNNIEKNPICKKAITHSVSLPESKKLNSLCPLSLVSKVSLFSSFHSMFSVSNRLTTYKKHHPTCERQIHKWPAGWLARCPLGTQSPKELQFPHYNYQTRILT